MKGKGAGAGHPHVLKNELTGKKTGLAEQRALDRSWCVCVGGKDYMISGRRGRPLRRTTETWCYVGRKLKLEGPKLNQNLIWLLPLKTIKILL